MTLMRLGDATCPGRGLRAGTARTYLYSRDTTTVQPTNIIALPKKSRACQVGVKQPA
jgi:hypothetical protein